MRCHQFCLAGNLWNENSFKFLEKIFELYDSNQSAMKR